MTTESDKRPRWKFDHIMSESEFRKFMALPYTINKVKACQKIHNDYTSTEWLEVATENGKWHRMPKGWEKLLVFTGDYCVPGIFETLPIWDDLQENIGIIDEWEDIQWDERAEYERLKAKFGD